MEGITRYEIAGDREKQILRASIRTLILLQQTAHKSGKGRAKINEEAEKV